MCLDPAASFWTSPRQSSFRIFPLDLPAPGLDIGRTGPEEGLPLYNASLPAATVMMRMHILKLLARVVKGLAADLDMLLCVFGVLKPPKVCMRLGLRSSVQPDQSFGCRA